MADNTEGIHKLIIDAKHTADPPDMSFSEADVTPEMWIELADWDIAIDVLGLTSLFVGQFYQPPLLDADFDWLTAVWPGEESKTRIQRWFELDPDNHLRVVKWCLGLTDVEDVPGMILTQSDEQWTEAQMRFYEICSLHQEQWGLNFDLGDQSIVLLIKKYFSAADSLDSINNPFKEKDPTTLERTLGIQGRGDQTTRYNNYGVASFGKRVLDFLRGEKPGSQPNPIFSDVGITAEARNVSGTATPFVGHDEQDWNTGVLPTVESFVDLVMLPKDQFENGATAKEKERDYYGAARAIVEACWTGKLPEDYAPPKSIGTAVMDTLGSIWEGIDAFGVAVGYGDWDNVDQKDMSQAVWKPVPWAGVEGRILQTVVAGGVPGWLSFQVDQTMPMEIKITGNGKEDMTLPSGDMEKFTGEFLEDTAGDKKLEKAVGVGFAQKLWKYAKYPADGRLPSKWFQSDSMTSPYPNCRLAGLSSETQDAAGLSVSMSTMTENADLKSLLTELKVTSLVIKNNSRVFCDQSGKNFQFDDNFMRRFYLAHYFQFLLYEMIEEHRGSGYYLHHHIMDFVAYKTAAVMNALWTQYAHDVTVADTYAAIVALFIYDPDAAGDLIKELGAGLLEETEDVVDEQLQEVADDPLIEEAGAANKDQRELLYKQCALMLNMHSPIMWMRNRAKYTNSDKHFHKANAQHSYGSYNHRIHLVTSGEQNATATPTRQANNLLNRIIAPKAGFIEPFLNIGNEQVASLVPYIRLFKVYNDKEKLIETEFEFPTHPGLLRDSLKGLLSSKFDRGDGVGLKEFKWELDGETPATASKYVKAQMTLFFQTFTDFTSVRNNSKGEQYRYVDLFVSPVSMKKRKGDLEFPSSLHYDPEYYRIKVEVGYRMDPSGGVPINDNGRIARALKMLRRVYSLVLVDNEININEDGTVNLTANYRAYMEEAMDSFKFNALNSRRVREERAGWREDWLEAIGEGPDGDAKKCTNRQLQILRNKIDGRMSYLAKIQHRAIMESLLLHKRIHWMDFDPVEIEKFRSNGRFTGIPQFDLGAGVTPYTGTAGDEFKAWLDSQKNKNADEFTVPNDIAGDYRAYYFYLGDLIYTVVSNLYKEGVDRTSSAPLPGAENIKFILTDFQYYNPFDVNGGITKCINIADIPINVDFFFQWYINNVVKADIVAMPIGAFIRRMLTSLVSEALREVCLNKSPDFHTTFKMANFMAGGIPVEGTLLDPIQAMLKLEKNAGADFPDRLNVENHYSPSMSPANGDFSLPLRNIPYDESGIDNQYNYIIIYGDFKNPAHPGRGSRESDHNAGTYHVDIGRDRGLVKKVSFSKNNIKYHRESRMFNQGQAGLLQLSAVYNCSIDMIGNTLFLPGMEIWVNPYGFGGEAFGKPQDPPLTTGIPGEMIDARNRMVTDAMSAQPGDATPLSIDEAEMQSIRDTDQMLEDEYGVNFDSLGGGQAEPVIDSVDANYINSYANVMGIGGYQLITRIESKISPGSFTTNVSAVHTFTGYPDLLDANKLHGQGKKKINDPNLDKPTGDGGAFCDEVIGRLEELERDV